MSERRTSWTGQRRTRPRLRASRRRVRLPPSSSLDAAIDMSRLRWIFVKRWSALHSVAIRPGPPLAQRCIVRRCKADKDVDVGIAPVRQRGTSIVGIRSAHTDPPPLTPPAAPLDPGEAAPPGRETARHAPPGSVKQGEFGDPDRDRRRTARVRAQRRQISEKRAAKSTNCRRRNAVGVWPTTTCGIRCDLGQIAGGAVYSQSSEAVSRCASDGSVGMATTNPRWFVASGR